MSDVTVTPGTIAVLKSGGPKMTVVSVSPTIPPTVKCTWFTEDASDVKVPWDLSRLQWLIPAGQA